MTNRKFNVVPTKSTIVTADRVVLIDSEDSMKLKQADATAFKGVKGDTGDTGPAGPIGATGLAWPAGPQGPTGATGATGAPGATWGQWTSINSVVLTSGTHAPGTLDTYTINYSNSTTSTFQVYNGENGVAGNSGNNTYMMSGVASDISGYGSLPSLNAYVSGSTDVTFTSLTTADTLIKSFSTDLGFPNVTVVPAGTFTVHYEINKLANSHSYITFARIYKRSSTGVETLLFTTDESSSISANTIQSIDLSAVSVSPISMLVSDRLVVKVYAHMVDNTGDVNLRVDGATQARFITPVVTVDATNFIPYTGATADVNLGSKKITANSIELGNASDTTISRLSAWVVAIEGVAIPAIAPSTSGNVMTSNGTSWISSAPASSGHIIKDEGTTLATRPSLNFKGANITVTDNALENSTDVTITPTTLSPAYTVTNVTTDRTFDADSTSINELADVLGTVIQDITLYSGIGGGGSGTNLAYIASPTNGLVTSDTGTDATIPLADGTNAGLMTAAEKTKVGNTSGTNTWDETKSSIETKLGVATSSNSGYLSSTDWSTFNGKQPAGTYSTDIHSNITALNAVSGTNTGNQTITNTFDTTSHTVTMSASGGSVQLIEGSGITLTTWGTSSDGTVTIAATNVGTVTNSTNLDANYLVLGDGSGVVKTNGNYITDGDGNLRLGVGQVTDGSISFKQMNSLFQASISAAATNLTTNRVVSLPNESGTIALTSIVSDTVFWAGWDGDTTKAPSKNAVYDEMELKAPKLNAVLDYPTLTGTVIINVGTPTVGDVLTCNDTTGEVIWAPATWGAGWFAEIRIQDYSGSATIGILGMYDATRTGTLQEVTIISDTRPVGSNLVAELRKNSTTSGNVLSSALQVTTTETATNGRYVWSPISSFTSTAIAAGDVFYVVLTSVGSTTAALNARVILRYT